MNHILFDIDGTIAEAIIGISDTDPRAITFKKYGYLIHATHLHFVPHNFITLIRLLDQNNIRVGFFSAGISGRNISLVEALLKLALGEKRYLEIAPSLKILSRNDLTTHPYDPNAAIKDLNKARIFNDPSDSLANTVLVDDNIKYAHPEQIKNFLLTPTQTFHSNNVCDKLIFSIDYISGLLFSAIENAKASGSSLSHELFQLQRVHHGNGRYGLSDTPSQELIDTMLLIGKRYLHPLTAAMEEDEQKAREAIHVEVQTAYRHFQTEFSDEQKARETIIVTAQTAHRQIQAQFFRAGFFLSRRAQGVATASHRISSDTVNPILQHVVYGDENTVKAALVAAKDNFEQLAALLCDTGTMRDYSDRTITGMTVLQAAAAAGDTKMCLMLKDHMTPEEFSKQLAELFPNGIEAHEEAQKRNTFNFDAISRAIDTAKPADIQAALYKNGTQLTESDSARAKPDSALSLTEALNRFREQFAQLSHREKIFNPQHLLRAFKIYEALLRTCSQPGSDQYKKCILIWRQIVGYIQRFIPACYAQAFTQGLANLVKGDRGDWWRPIPFIRSLKFKYDTCTYFPLPTTPCSGLGFDFAISSGGGPEGNLWDNTPFFQNLLSEKNSELSEMCAARTVYVTMPERLFLT